MHHHDADAENRVARVDVALHPVVRRAVTELAHRFFVLRFGAIEFRAFEQHLPDAARLRAVRIFFGFALRVVLAVNRGPLAGQHAGGHPQPEAEEMTGDGMQLQRAVRLAAVQIDRDADDRDVGHHEREQQDLPPGKVEQSVGEKIKRGIQQGNLPVEAAKMAGRKVIFDECWARERNAQEFDRILLQAFQVVVPKEKFFDTGQNSRIL